MSVWSPKEIFISGGKWSSMIVRYAAFMSLAMAKISEPFIARRRDFPSSGFYRAPRESAMIIRSSPVAGPFCYTSFVGGAIGKCDKDTTCKEQSWRALPLPCCF
jgi:hypothetical protein